MVHSNIQKYHRKYIASRDRCRFAGLKVTRIQAVGNSDRYKAVITDRGKAGLRSLPPRGQEL